MTDLSLIVAYRNRLGHLESLLNWFPEAQRRTAGAIELVIVESSILPTLDAEKLPPSVRYHHLVEEGPFNKSRILNEGLKIATGRFVTPFDVDLIPFALSFEKHLELARTSPKLLITGFRLVTPFRTFVAGQLEEIQKSASIARENLHEGFLRDQLLHGHRFGVIPFFDRQMLTDIEGWDEHYVGWGGEDQDVIHRYLSNNRFLLTSPDLLYLHLEHDHVKDWNDGDLTRKNREYLYKKLNITPNIV